MRADGERRAALLASTDVATGLYNRKGFAEHALELCQRTGAAGQQLAILSVQIHRFKAVNDRHGYEAGDQLLRAIAVAMGESAGPEAVIARLSGDEFAIAFALDESELERAERVGDEVLLSVMRPFMIGERMVQVSAFAGIAAVPASEARIPDLLRRAEAEVIIAALGREKLVTGRCGVTIEADTTLDEVAESEFDLLFIPGGPGVKALRTDGRPAKLAKAYAAAGKTVTAICAAPTVLADAGLLKGRRFTAHFSVHSELPGVLAEERVVKDGNLITSRGAGTAPPSSGRRRRRRTRGTRSRRVRARCGRPSASWGGRRGGSSWAREAGCVRRSS